MIWPISRVYFYHYMIKYTQKEFQTVEMKVILKVDSRMVSQDLEDHLANELTNLISHPNYLEVVSISLNSIGIPIQENFETNEE